MKEGSTTGKCVEAILKLSQISVTISDSFFVAKINHVSENLLTSYMQLDKNAGSPNVAQYKLALLHKTIEQALDILSELHHLNLTPTTPLLDSQKTLLEFRILTAATLKSEKLLEARTGDQNVVQATGHNKNFSPTKLTENQEKILRFIVSARTVRTKDIIDEFASLSQRTVKRNLRELVGQGRLHRKAENKAVYYSTTGLT